MPMNLDDIKRLAPDPKAFTTAKGIARPNHWPVLGRTGDVVWGECQGSERYAVVADEKNKSFECSCPSRKRPCKHTLGLLILSAGGHPIPDKPADNALFERARSWRYSSSWE